MSNEPKVWKKLGGYIHQDYMLDHPDFWSGIEEFRNSLSKAEKIELIQFLRSLVENEQPGGNLKKVWKNSGAQIFMSRVKPSEFFQELLSRVGGKDT